mmetsp:Transcript_11301/g.19248  ORF Transcript_11301/g.19248 Transcript_11301/m.19248 type:complete len:602 (-) Transcript_11301:90-1895(-)
MKLFTAATHLHLHDAYKKDVKFVRVYFHRNEDTNVSLSSLDAKYALSKVHGGWVMKSHQTNKDYDLNQQNVPDSLAGMQELRANGCTTGETFAECFRLGHTNTRNEKMAVRILRHECQNNEVTLEEFQIRRDLLMEHKDEIGRTNTLPVQVHVQVEQNDSRQLGAPRPTRATSIGDVPNARMEGSKVDNAPGAAGLPQPGVDKYVIPSESFLDSKHVVVFGVFPGYDIEDVKTMVKSFGGEVRIRYSKGKTDFLLAEDDNRKKINDFKEKGGVEHITLAATLALLKKNTSVDEADHVGGGVNHYGAGVGAGVPSMAGAGDGASTGNELDAFKLKMAEMNFQKAKRIAELEVQQKESMAKLEVRQKELEVQQKKNMVETHERINKNTIAISDVQVEQVRMKGDQVRMKGDITKVGATADRADSKADEALESSKNANERVEGLHDQLSRTATKKDLQSLEERAGKKLASALRRSEDDGMKEDGGEDDGLIGAALDFSDSSSDDESALPPSRAGVTAVTPMDKKTVKVSKVAPEREFLRLLKEAMHYGQGGKEFEMDACLKRAEHIMNSTKLNEEWNRWHANFNKRSECARKLCSQYGSKPAAR